MAKKRSGYRRDDWFAPIFPECGRAVEQRAKSGARLSTTRPMTWRPITRRTTTWRPTPGYRRSQPPIRQTSKGSKPPSEFLGSLLHREHHRTLRRSVGEFGSRAKIKRPEPVYQAGAEGQLDRPEHIAIVMPARFSKPPALSKASSESSSLRICSSARSSPKLLTFMALISFVRPRRRYSSRRRCCLSNPAPIHIVV